MVTPLKAMSSGVKDAYNFYQSQLRINVECAFGVLTNRWTILRSYSNAYFTRENNISDRLNLISRGGEILLDTNSRLDKALDGGDHYDDCEYEERRNR